MDLNQARRQKIFLVTGKGGVGKTSFATALALKGRKMGHSVLLAELGESSSLSHFFDMKLSHEPQESSLKLPVVLWSGESCLREYIFHYVRVPSLVDLFFGNPVTRALIRAAPGLFELALTGKITSGIRKIGPPLSYDWVVVDGFSMGHFLALLRAPKGMAEAIPFGPMGEQSLSIMKVLIEVARYFVVSLPEELPTSETAELTQKLKVEFGVMPEIVLNRLVKLKSDLGEGSQPEWIKEIFYFLKETEKQQTPFVERHLQLDPNVTMVPMIFDSNPLTICERISEHIREPSYEDK